MQMHSYTVAIMHFLLFYILLATPATPTYYTYGWGDFLMQNAFARPKEL